MSPATPRPGVRDVEPYTSPQLDVAARLNTNECPYPLPEGFAAELARAVRALPLNRYPDQRMARLREALADAYDHPVAGVWAANGSNEVLEQLLLAYGGPGRRAVTFEPTYLLHARIAWLTHTEVARLSLAEGFALGEAEIERAVAERPDVVFVCSPNNPTGNAQPIAAIRALAERLPASLVIVDEAYVEFGAESALPLVATHPNVAIVRTFSKAFACAGVRLGVALAAPEVVSDLERVRLPYHLSSLAQAAGVVALNYRSHALAICEEVRRERDRIAAALSTLAGVTSFPSQANFVLFVPPMDATELWRRLLDRGVLVRDLSTVVPGALRVTAGARHEVDLFLKALEEELRA
ncbi:MAG: histidinol-phosphate aminotransferase [Actinomycetota bacterium]|jgi:histidinol-phosphate aminotransferase|nr:MAG: histidinol-phosphate aminotransferase [Actinomycetota bacterium]